MIEGNKPSSFSKFINNDPFNLNNRDIDGAQAGSKNRINKYCSKDYNLRVDDIDLGKKQAKFSFSNIKSDSNLNNKEQIRVNKSSELFRKDEIKEILTPKKYDFYKISYPFANLNAPTSNNLNSNYQRNSPYVPSSNEQLEDQYK